jgi:YD repeat-containing protein
VPIPFLLAHRHRHSFVLTCLVTVFATLGADTPNAKPVIVDNPTTPERVEITGQRIREERGLKSASPRGGGGSGAGGMSFTESASQSEGSNQATDSKNNTSLTCPTTGKPVQIATGEKFQEETDFTSLSLDGLTLQRTYRANTWTGFMFGGNWPSSLDFPSAYSDSEFEDYVALELPGRGTTYVPPEITFSIPMKGAVSYQLVVSNSLPVRYRARNNAMAGEIYYDPSTQDPRAGVVSVHQTDTVTVFPAAWGGPITVYDRVGNAIRQYRYVDGLPGEIWSRNGQVVRFVWSRFGPGGAFAHVTQVVDPGGGVWKYEYTYWGSVWGKLTGVTPPGHSSPTRIYHYEEAESLTGVSFRDDSVVTRRSRVAYSINGGLARVRQSGLADGEDVDTFAYSSTTTTVTNAQGHSTTYTFAPSPQDPTAKRLVAVSSTGSQTCGPVSRTIAYDSNGYTDHEINGRGFRTEYTYDAQGLLQDRTTASGTNVALTEVYSWAST